MKKVAIVGIFYDGYKDLWEDFVVLFEKYWPDCPYKKFIINQSAEFDLKSSFTVYHAGKDAEYSKKVQTAIEKIDADYYILLLEDFFVERKVDGKKVEFVLDYLIDNGFNYCSMPLPEFKKSFKGKKQKNKMFLDISPKAEYTVSCQAAIWEKHFLKSCIGKENYNAWVFEGVYSKSKFAHSKAFLSKCCATKSNPLNLRHGALQGKMIPKTMKRFKKNGYQMSTQREVLSTKLYFKHQLKSFLKSIVPLGLQKKIKKKILLNSTIEKYNGEIERVMDSLGIF